MLFTFTININILLKLLKVVDSFENIYIGYKYKRKQIKIEVLVCWVCVDIYTRRGDESASEEFGMRVGEWWHKD